VKKLSLDSLRVDSFATSSADPRVRGTVVGGERSGTCPPETTDCPISWEGTCYFTCFETCPGCTAGPDCA
jgi:hypothetical protein